MEDEGVDRAALVRYNAAKAQNKTAEIRLNFVSDPTGERLSTSCVVDGEENAPQTVDYVVYMLHRDGREWNMSPWGLWTTKTRNWFRVNRARYGGIGESAFGTLRLITSLALALGSFFYFRAHIAAEQALSIAQFAIINASVALFKVWWALFFDYRDARAAFVVIMFATFFNVAAAVIAGVVAEESPGLGWTSFGLLLFHALTLAYLTAMSWNWQVHTGMTRKQARALDVARGLDSEM